jgi:hypothetical protein
MARFTSFSITAAVGAGIIAGGVIAASHSSASTATPQVKTLAVVSHHVSAPTLVGLQKQAAALASQLAAARAAAARTPMATTTVLAPRLVARTDGGARSTRVVAPRALHAHAGSAARRSSTTSGTTPLMAGPMSSTSMSATCAANWTSPESRRSLPPCGARVSLHPSRGAVNRRVTPSPGGRALGARARCHSA